MEDDRIDREAILKGVDNARLRRQAQEAQLIILGNCNVADMGSGSAQEQHNE